MLGIRRDRLLVLLLLGGLLSADFYFHLWPQVRRRLAPAGADQPDCACPTAGDAAAAFPPSAPEPAWTRTLDETPEDRRRPAAESKLRRLFAHPLYSAPEGPAEKLLSAQETLRYYRRKVARWNRMACEPKTAQGRQKREWRKEMVGEAPNGTPSEIEETGPPLHVDIMAPIFILLLPCCSLSSCSTRASKLHAARSPPRSF